ncbi:MAG: hypothetical protein AAF958_15610 [Planctomycetota bacterium]
MRIQKFHADHLATQSIFFAIVPAALVCCALVSPASADDLDALVGEVDFARPARQAIAVESLPQLPGHRALDAASGMLNSGAAFKMPVDVVPAPRMRRAPLSESGLIHGRASAVDGNPAVNMKPAIEMAPAINFDDVFEAADAQPSGHRLLNKIVGKHDACDAPASCDAPQHNPFVRNDCACEVLPPKPCKGCLGLAKREKECGCLPGPPVLQPHIPAQLPPVSFYQNWYSDPVQRDVWNGYERQNCKLYEGCPPAPKQKSCQSCGPVLAAPAPTCATADPCDTCH